MPYENGISVREPAAVFFLLDQTLSMNGKVAGMEATKAQIAATAVNRLLQEIVMLSQEGSEFVERFDIAMIGYGGADEIYPAFQGVLNDGSFAPKSSVSIAHHPVRVERKIQKKVDAHGNTIDIPVMFPTWLDARADGEASTEEAFLQVYTQVSAWVETHRSSFPPIVIHITDGYATDEVETVCMWAHAIQGLSTDNGHTLLITLFLSETDPSILALPDDVGLVPELPGKWLFENSSVLPVEWRYDLQRTEVVLNQKSRAFFQNCDITAIVSVLSRASTTPRWSIDALINEENLSHGDEANTSTLVPASRNTSAAPSGGRMSPIVSQKDEVHFSAYYPREAEPGQTSAFIVYAHLSDLLDQINLDVQFFRAQLGDHVPRARTGKQSASITRGTPMTITLECDTMEFEPLLMTKRWAGEWVRFAFEFAPFDTQVGDTLDVRVRILLGGIEIAAIDRCAIEIIPTNTPVIQSKPTNPFAPIGEIQPMSSARQVVASPPPAAQNPLKHAKAQVVGALGHKTAVPYKHIFISYSHRDTVVAEAYRFAQLALNNTVFMDFYSLPSGGNWQAELAKAIDIADVFQLFWSPEAAMSEYVRAEWDYALRERCAGNDGSGYILPVYWREPMPAPPPELGHLHFRYVKFHPLPDPNHS